MNVVFCKWGSICETGMDNGFVALHHNVIRINRPLDSVDYDTDYAQLLSDTLKKQPVDLVFSINFIPIIARVCKIHNILYVCQVVDNPCMQLYSKTMTYDTNRIFLFDRDLYHKFHSVNPSCIFNQPLATDMVTWDDLQVSEEEHNFYACDVSFIGSLYSDKVFSLYNKIEDKLPEYIKGYVEGVIDAQINIMGHYLIRESLTPEFIEEFKKYADWVPLNDDYVKNDGDIVADVYIGHKCTERARTRYLNALAEHFHVDLYTTSDTSDLVNVNSRGPADSLTMMPKIIRCTKINLNITSKTITSTLPLRCFDVMGNGGFMLSNYQPEIPEMFEIGKEIETFESIPDMIDKVAYYLEHEDERLAIAQRGYNKVREYHSCVVRLQKILQLAGLEQVSGVDSYDN